MKLEKAIEINTAVENYEMCCWMPKALEAQKLGIEALKRVKELRVSGKPDRYSILPGEDT